ncbi:inward rectifier potassium channel 16 isoform X2 [Denticeps clupeoides]|nr:inward rectifier potassium channel 16-like isoform X2 [Denticeps clupeoides]
MRSGSTQYRSVRCGDDGVGVRREDGRLYKRRCHIRKDGGCNMVFRHIPEGWLLYVTDIFTTLVEIRWRVMILTFALSYILSWLLFGMLFWIIALSNGDVKEHVSEPCMYSVHSFTAAFLFSLETQTTIGYGFRGMSENCALAIMLVTVQDVLSVFIDTCVIGITVAKMASARKRAQTVGFTNCAAISMRNGALCLSWRVGDFRRNHMVEGTAQAQIIRTLVDPASKLNISYKDLRIEESNVILATPTTIVHHIGPDSPLYRTGLQDLRREDFELVVSFTYTDDTTGILHQTRTSYAPGDILWGRHFQEMLRVSKSGHRVNYALFNKTTRVAMPTVSAEERDRRRPPKRPPDAATFELANGNANAEDDKAADADGPRDTEEK